MEMSSSLFNNSETPIFSSPIKHQNDCIKTKSILKINTDNSNYSINTISIFNDINSEESGNISSESHNDYYIKDFDVDFPLSISDFNSLIHKKRKSYEKFRKDNIRRKIIVDYFKFLSYVINK